VNFDTKESIIETTTPTPIKTPLEGAVPSSAPLRFCPRWRRDLPFLIPLAAMWGLVVLASLNLFLHSGAFWRDELSSIMLAQLPAIADMYANLDHDSAPLLFACLVKAWIALGPGASDSGLALLGFLVYGGLVGALCWATRSLGVRLPLIGSVFLLMNGPLFYWGTSIRSYGLAALLAAVLVGCVWRFVLAGSLRWWLMTAFAAVLCAQANYQNTYVIFSLCTAGAAVCALQRQWRRSAATLLTGACAAASLVPYYPIIAHASMWTMLLFPAPFDPALFFIDSLSILGSGFVGFGLLWIPLPIWLVTDACRRGWKACRSMQLGVQTLRALFAGMTLLLLALSVLMFAWKVGHIMQPWYFLPGLTVLACFLDLPLQRFCRRRLAVWCIAGASVLLLLLQTPELLSNSVTRRTNLDIVAKQIAGQAVPGDFIVVSPLWLGHAFKYHYRGAASWMLVPGVKPEDIGIGLDGASIVSLARSPQAAGRPLYQEIERTLRSGHRVWVVGDVRTPQDRKLPILPSSLEIDAYTDYWGCVLGMFLQQHATGGTPLQVATAGAVMPLESLPVRLYSGWRE
jgi:hypothetical protein